MSFSIAFFLLLSLLFGFLRSRRLSRASRFAPSMPSPRPFVHIHSHLTNKMNATAASSISRNGTTRNTDDKKQSEIQQQTSFITDFWHTNDNALLGLSFLFFFLL